MKILLQILSKTFEDWLKKKFSALIQIKDSWRLIKIKKILVFWFKSKTFEVKIAIVKIWLKIQSRNHNQKYARSYRPQSPSLLPIISFSFYLSPILLGDYFPPPFITTFISFYLSPIFLGDYFLPHLSLLLSLPNYLLLLLPSPSNPARNLLRVSETNGVLIKIVLITI